VSRPVAVTLLGLAAAAPAQRLSLHGPEPATIAVHERATCVVRLEDGGASASLGALPAVEGLKLAVEPGTPALVQTFAAGRIADGTCTLWTLTLSPERTGTFELPPLGVTVEGATLTTAPVRLEVLAALGGGDHAFAEVVTDASDPWLQETFAVTLRFGIERGFLAEHLVPMFARPLDLPVQVHWSWTGLPATVEASFEATDAGTVRFALADAEATAVRVAPVTRAGKVFACFELRRHITPTASGELDLPVPVLRFAYATRFDDDFVNGRMPGDRHEGCVRGAGRRVVVRPLPASGRPAGFTGAVGQFRTHAEASAGAVRVGDSLRLTLAVDGVGNLTTFAPPALTQLSDFHVYGCVAGVADGRRTFTYDLTPLSTAVTGIPALGLDYFDPRAGAYRVARTDPLPLTVVAGAPDAPRPAPAAGLVPGTSDIHPPPHPGTAADPRSVSAWQLALAFVLPWVLAFTARAAQRARARVLADPHGERARRAAATFRAAVAAPGGDVAAAFAAYLAARLHCPPAAVVGPDLDARLRGAGISPDLAARAAHTAHELVAARYGGAGTVGREQVVRSVDELEAAFAATERR